MRKIIIILFLLSTFSFRILPKARAVMLSAERIAYVDIEKVFNEYKGTKEAKRRLAQDIRKKRKEIADKAIKKRASQLKDVIVSTSSTVSPEDSDLLGLQDTDSDKFLRSIQEELTKKEKNLTEQIYGMIYDVVKEVAIAEGYTIVLDKNNILYSSRDADITEKVLRKLNRNYELRYE